MHYTGQLTSLVACQYKNQPGLSMLDMPDLGIPVLSIY